MRCKSNLVLLVLINEVCKSKTVLSMLMGVQVHQLVVYKENASQLPLLLNVHHIYERYCLMKDHVPVYVPPLPLQYVESMEHLLSTQRDCKSLPP